MDAERRRELEASLRNRLDAQAGDARPLTRLVWVADQLENYVERWAAFRELAPSAAAGDPGDDLFDVVEIGAALFSEEVERLSPPARDLHQAWARFLDTLTRLRGVADRETIALLRLELAVTKAALSTAAQESSDGY